MVDKAFIKNVKNVYKEAGIEGIKAEFIKAAFRCNMDECKFLYGYQKKGSHNVRVSWVASAFIEAASKGNRESLQFINNHLYPYVYFSEDFRLGLPLSRAVQEAITGKHAEVLRDLFKLSNEACYKQTSFEDIDYILAACRTGDKKIVSIVGNKVCSNSRRLSFKETAKKLLDEDDPNLLKVMLQACADKFSNNDLIKVLNCCIEEDREAHAHIALQQLLSVFHKDSSYLEPVLRLSFRKEMYSITLALPRSLAVDPNLLDMKVTAALKTGDVEAAGSILRYNADRFGIRSQEPLVCLAARFGCHRAIEHSLQHGMADANTRGSEGTPLHFVLRNILSPKLDTMLKTLFSFGADPNSLNPQGQSPLELTRGLSDGNLCRIRLLQAGANPFRNEGLYHQVRDGIIAKLFGPDIREYRTESVIRELEKWLKSPRDEEQMVQDLIVPNWRASNIVSVLETASESQKKEYQKAALRGFVFGFVRDLKKERALTVASKDGLTGKEFEAGDHLDAWTKEQLQIIKSKYADETGEVPAEREETYKASIEYFGQNKTRLSSLPTELLAYLIETTGRMSSSEHEGPFRTFKAWSQVAKRTSNVGQKWAESIVVEDYTRAA